MVWRCSGLESQPLPVPSNRQPSRAPLSLLSSMCSPQWPQETVTRDGLDLAHCQCLNLVITGAVVDFCGGSDGC